jgi:hypothetical protein
MIPRKAASLALAAFLGLATTILVYLLLALIADSVTTYDRTIHAVALMSLLSGGAVSGTRLSRASSWPSYVAVNPAPYCLLLVVVGRFTWAGVGDYLTGAATPALLAVGVAQLGVLTGAWFASRAT